MSENKELLAKSVRKEIYKEGNSVYKTFAPGTSKAEVLNEAVNTARVEETGLDMCKIQEVSLKDGRWTIVTDYIDGKTLYQLMEENPADAEKYIDMMVDLHMDIFSKKCPLLTRLKDKLQRQITECEGLSDATRYELSTRLDGFKKHLKLTHGDFEPKNIIIHDDKPYVIDWIHAAQGNASADVARTYLLLCLENPKWADMYLDKFCEKSGTQKTYVQRWLPIIAAAQLTKNRPEEKDLLMKWVDVCEYQ